MRRVIYFSLLSIFFILSNIPICSAVENITGQKLVDRQVENVFIGPLFEDTSNLRQTFQVYEPLFYHKDGYIIPAIGKTYKWLDSTTLEIALNQGAYFNFNKKKVTADDAVASLQVVKKYRAFNRFWQDLGNVYKADSNTIILKIESNNSKEYIIDQILFSTLIVPQKFANLLLNTRLNQYKTTNAFVKPNATIITQVKPLGQVVVGLAIEYQKNINAEQVNVQTYEVTANRINELGGEIFPRTITKVYTNSQPFFTEKPTSGKYVIIELYNNDINASTYYHGPRDEFNHIYKLEYIVNQRQNIQSNDNVLIPASVFIGEKLNNLVEDKFLDLQYIDKSGKVLPYRLYVPDINSSKYYPLILFLHGAGERGSDNKLQLMANRGAIVWAEDVVQTEHPCFVLAPQCPQTSSWTELLTSGDPFKSTPYLDMVYELILDIEKKYNNIDKRRIYSTGLSMGGFGTWTINIAHPKVFTAIVPICGGGDPAKANLLVNKPIWAFHSEDDPVVDVAFSRNMVNALKKLGSNVKYTEYDKGVVAPPLAPMAHFSWVPAYNDQDMIEWLFLQ